MAYLLSCGALIQQWPAPGLAGVTVNRNSDLMVGGTRIELVTPSMSTKCSTAELTAHFCLHGPCPLMKKGREIRAGERVYKSLRHSVQGLLEYLISAL